MNMTYLVFCYTLQNDLIRLNINQTQLFSSLAKYAFLFIRNPSCPGHRTTCQLCKLCSLPNPLESRHTIVGTTWEVKEKVWKVMERRLFCLLISENSLENILGQTDVSTGLCDFLAHPFKKGRKFSKQALAGVAQLVGYQPLHQTGCWLDSLSGHMFELQAQFPVGMQEAANW